MLTARQQEIWDFLVTYVDDHGYPPTVREIGEAVGLASPSTVHAHLANLERAGLLRRDPTKPRALELTGRERPASERPSREGDLLPLLGQIAAGGPLLAAEQVEEYVSVPGVVGPADFVLRVKGDSMIGRHICDGDIVVLEHGAEPRHGQIVAALIDRKNTLKTFLLKSGRPYLRAENPKYPDLIPCEELLIQGVFKALIRKARE